MARPLRIEFPGACYHVTSRGDGGDDIFRDAADRQTLLRVLARVVEHARWRCHAYCLMGNHYHLLIETPEGNLAWGMRHLNGIYTQRFNRRHLRTGHVFQGRYHAVLVDRDAYLLQAARYIVLNPVRAGLVERADQWAWSSFRATAGLAASPSWLTARAILACFGEKEARARQSYAEFVFQGTDSPSLWQGLRQQIYLGDDDFVLKTLHGTVRSGDPVEVPRIQRNVVRPLDWYLARYGKGERAMKEAYRSGQYSLAAIARRFGVHYSSVSRVVNAERVLRLGGRRAAPDTASAGLAPVHGNARPDPGG